VIVISSKQRFLACRRVCSGKFRFKRPATTVRASDDEDLMLTVGARENLDNMRCHVISTPPWQPLSSCRLPAHCPSIPQTKTPPPRREAAFCLIVTR